MRSNPKLVFRFGQSIYLILLLLLLLMMLFLLLLMSLLWLYLLFMILGYFVKVNKCLSENPEGYYLVSVGG